MFAPVRPAERERAMLTMTRVEAIPMASMKEGMPWNWVTFPEFLDAVDKAPKAVNILPYVPISPLLIWVMGFEAAKAGNLPTPEQHAELKRLLNEAMDAGACGWSAQRMLPTGPAAVQRDHDGTPMPTDVMHDDTCREFARVLADRNDGFMQMLLVSGDNTRDRLFYEEMATLSGRPIIMNVVQAFDDRRRGVPTGSPQSRARPQRRCEFAATQPIDVFIREVRDDGLQFGILVEKVFAVPVAVGGRVALKLSVHRFVQAFEDHLVVIACE